MCLSWAVTPSDSLGFHHFHHIQGCSNRRRRGNVTDCYHALQKCLHWLQTSPRLLETFTPMNAMFCCCCSVIQSCLTLCNPMDWSMPSLPCPSPSPGVCSSSYPLSQWCHPTISPSVTPLLLLPSIFPNIRVFSHESALHIRWPKYSSFSFSNSPSNE